jgi:hypothetical protein
MDTLPVEVEVELMPVAYPHQIEIPLTVMVVLVVVEMVVPPQHLPHENQHLEPPILVEAVVVVLLALSVMVEVV